MFVNDAERKREKKDDKHKEVSSHRHLYAHASLEEKRLVFYTDVFTSVKETVLLSIHV